MGRSAILRSALNDGCHKPRLVARLLPLAQDWRIPGSKLPGWCAVEAYITAAERAALLNRERTRSTKKGRR